MKNKNIKRCVLRECIRSVMKSLTNDRCSESKKSGILKVVVLTTAIFLHASLLFPASPMYAVQKPEATLQTSIVSLNSQIESSESIATELETSDLTSSEAEAEPNQNSQATEQTETETTGEVETEPTTQTTTLTDETTEGPEPEPTTQSTTTTAETTDEFEPEPTTQSTTTTAETTITAETSSDDASLTETSQSTETEAPQSEQNETNQSELFDLEDKSVSNTELTDDLTVVDIILIHEPYNLVYKQGENLDLDGLVVHRVFENESEEPVDVGDLLISGFDSSVAGSIQAVTLSYDDFSVSFTITIEPDNRGIIGWVIDNPFISMLIILLMIIFVTILSSSQKRKRKQAQKQRYQMQKRASAGNVIGEKILLVQNQQNRQKSSRMISQNTRQKHMNSSINGSTNNDSKPRKSKKKLLLIIPIALLVLLLLGYGGLLNLLGGMEREKIPQDDEALGIDQESGDPRITNIAVFGIDSVDGMTGRSDAIMILTLDEKHDKIKITSIVRDSYVDIPGRGLDKINHAYAFGGPELAIKTINQNFKLDIRHYISLNFSSMPAIIDAIDGVNITITDQEATQISGVNSGGTYTLNGDQALQFSRIRKIDSDFERSRRQRDVMEATIRTAFDKPITSYPSMINEIFPHMKTNLSSNQMLNMGRKAVINNIRTIEQVQFPPAFLGKGQTINGIYYYVFDREIGARKLSRYIFHDEPIEEK